MYTSTPRSQITTLESSGMRHLSFAVPGETPELPDIRCKPLAGPGAADQAKASFVPCPVKSQQALVSRQSNQDRFAEHGRGEPRGSELLLLRCSDGGSDIRHDLGVSVLKLSFYQGI